MATTADKRQNMMPDRDKKKHNYKTKYIMRKKLN